MSVSYPAGYKLVRQSDYAALERRAQQAEAAKRELVRLGLAFADGRIDEATFRQVLDHLASPEEKQPPQ